VGMFCWVIGGTGHTDELTGRVLVGLGIALCVAGSGGLGLLWLTDQRTRNIRRVLGPHDLGSSDPATWTADRLENVGTPGQMYGADTFVQAAERLLAENDYSEAMWAARYAVALEDRAAGERITDTILKNKGVSRALKVVKLNPRRWVDVM